MALDDDSANADEWNAWIIAPLLIGIGIGAIFGSLFAAGRPMYVVYITALAGLAIALAGMAMLRQCYKAAASRDDESNVESDAPPDEDG